MVWDSLSVGIAQARREMAARERRDIEQDEIAAAVGVTPAAYSRWEKGGRIPKEEDVQKLARFFGVSPMYLRYGVSASSPTLDRLGKEPEGRPADAVVVKPAAKRVNGGKKRA